MNKICKGDEVILLAGKDKGKHGKVLRVIPEKNRAFVEGLNLVKKTVRANPNTNQEAAIIDKEASIHLSNLAIYNSVTGKADKVAIKMIEQDFAQNHSLIT